MRKGRGFSLLSAAAKQPPDPSDPLLKFERVTLTPHVAGLTDRTYREVRRFDDPPLDFDELADVVEDLRRPPT